MTASLLTAIAARRRTGGWLALALLLAWAQLAAALHHHEPAAGPGEQRDWSCELCVAQSSAAAPPPALQLPPLPALAAIIAPASGQPVVPARFLRGPHSPRGPPAFRNA